MKTVVKLFQPRFAPLVEAGTKRQTIRRTPKRERDMPEVGDRFLAREWLGKPYVTKQRVLREGIVSAVHRCEITDNCMIVDSYAEDCESFAKADGFTDEFELRQWFKENHGLPFEGILIKWRDA